MIVFFLLKQSYYDYLGDLSSLKNKLEGNYGEDTDILDDYKDITGLR